MQTPQYVVTTTPHIRAASSIEKTMLLVLVALSPASVLGVVFFGLRALIIILISISSAVLAEYIYQKITKKQVRIMDGSAAVPGLLLGLIMPPAIPFWMPVVGAFAAIIIVKQIFGGLGHNFLNPALAGRAILVAAYALPMTTGFYEPFGPFINISSVDIVTTATPLKSAYLQPVSYDFINAALGNVSGSIGETSAIALFLGGVFLLYKKIITWHIPVSFIGTVFIFAFILAPIDIALYHVLTGGLLLGAFFMATDYPTSPITPSGKILFGIGCGVITVVIRFFGGYPEGVAYSILLMNLTVPLIDRFIRPRVFGCKSIFYLSTEYFLEKFRKGRKTI